MAGEQKYLWCCYCEETAFADNDWAIFCPSCGAGNGLPGDFLEWERFQRHHPQYPKVPLSGTRYPLLSETLRQELESARDKQFVPEWPDKALHSKRESSFARFFSRLRPRG